jgi:hypothetical protein
MQENQIQQQFESFNLKLEFENFVDNLNKTLKPF